MSSIPTSSCQLIDGKRFYLIYSLDELPIGCTLAYKEEKKSNNGHAYVSVTPLTTNCLLSISNEVYVFAHSQEKNKNSYKLSYFANSYENPKDRHCNYSLTNINNSTSIISFDS